MSRRLSLAVLCSALSLVAAAADVKIAGSDLLRGPLAKPLGGITLTDGRTVRLQLAGSRSGLEDLRAKRADLALVVFSPDEALPEKEFQLVPVAYQVVVFAVNKNNPVRQLTLAQLGGVYGEKEATNFRRWGELGAKDVWAQKTIALNKVAEVESLGVDLFCDIAMSSPQLKSTVLDLADADELLRKVRVDDTCIGLFLAPLPAEAGVNVLLVSKGAKDVPFSPTPENVNTGDYPLRLPFYVAFDRARAAELRPALAVLLGDGMAAALESAGLVAVPVNARRQARRALGLE